MKNAQFRIYASLNAITIFIFATKKYWSFAGTKRTKTRLLPSSSLAKFAIEEVAIGDWQWILIMNNS